ncbi:hypothetical protein DPMN_079423 [Dreissena polymorpha]|uniref:Uncharacterized protein n=1 Tax=Dreissena polymorpha TaxID=45954 RepID=A0A9D3YPH7_DREPO|nr:hypothetical protein DPMN_079423 [Dreissena polymorpha]
MSVITCTKKFAPRNERGMLRGTDSCPGCTNSGALSIDHGPQQEAMCNGVDEWLLQC